MISEMKWPPFSTDTLNQVTLQLPCTYSHKTLMLLPSIQLFKMIKTKRQDGKTNSLPSSNCL